MKDKNKELCVVFLSLGVVFMIISNTIDISWLKLTLMDISVF